MKRNLRSLLGLVLSELLLVNLALAARGTPPQVAAPAASPPASLSEDLQKSYLDLFREASTFNYKPAEIEKMRNSLKKAQDTCVNRFQNHRKQLQSDLQKAQNNLKQNTGKLSDAERHTIHCRIQALQVLESEADVLANHAIPVAYQNRQAKLNVIQNWPLQRKQIEQQMASGAYHQRRWGDVKDIGFRQIVAGQQDDIKVGQDAIRDMKSSRMMPKEVEDKAVVDYVTALAQRIAARSDLKVPLHVSVLDSKEVNAFALPGGYIFIERGLLEASDDESELAGVIAHEIAHDVARHGHQLMKKATIASIFYQAAQVAALILTGGAVGIGMYYALQYGFYGLGLVLNLKLLGVSRDFELQADQLGIQYAWNSGYDPDGFVRFFDKMATKEGYVNGVSWFRTHPPFYERMVGAQREITYLPSKPGLITQTDAFEQMKRELAKVIAAARQEEKKQGPSLFSGPEKGCTPPEQLEYQSGQPIEALCAARLTPPAAPK